MRSGEISEYLHKFAAYSTIGTGKIKKTYRKEWDTWTNH